MGGQATKERGPEPRSWTPPPQRCGQSTPAVRNYTDGATSQWGGSRHPRGTTLLVLLFRTLERQSSAWA